MFLHQEQQGQIIQPTRPFWQSGYKRKASPQSHIALHQDGAPHLSWQPRKLKTNHPLHNQYERNTTHRPSSSPRRTARHIVKSKLNTQPLPRAASLRTQHILAPSTRRSLELLRAETWSSSGHLPIRVDVPSWLAVRGKGLDQLEKRRIQRRAA